jgi:hypothetical protein
MHGEGLGHPDQRDEGCDRPFLGEYPGTDKKEPQKLARVDLNNS